jgi:hypothetical protein
MPEAVFFLVWDKKTETMPNLQELNIAGKV